MQVAEFEYQKICLGAETLKLGTTKLISDYNTQF